MSDHRNRTTIPFTKASAYGNDFLIVDAKHRGADPASLTRALCDRYNGVGADGVEWISAADECDARIHLINADGSFAEISGNGTRCVAAHLGSCNAGKSEFLISTDAGRKLCKLLGRDGNRFDFLTEMGEPKVGAPFELKLAGGVVVGTPVSMGNPHFVIFVDTFPADWQAVATEIQSRHDVFPNGINVEFVQVRSEVEIAIRIFERGAGETHSSGTGSSASAAAAIAAQRTAHELTVVAPGGAQRVSVVNGGSLFLEGSARLVCAGEFFV